MRKGGDGREIDLGISDMKGVLVPSAMNFDSFEVSSRDGEVPSQKELSSYFEELFSGKVPCQKELSSSNEELFPNPAEMAKN